RLRSAGGSTSSTTSVPRAIVTASPSSGTWPSGQADGSDQRTVLTAAGAASAAAAVASWSCPWLCCAATPELAASSVAGSNTENRWRRGSLRMTFIPSAGALRAPFSSVAASLRRPDRFAKPISGVWLDGASSDTVIPPPRAGASFRPNTIGLTAFDIGELAEFRPGTPSFPRLVRFRVGPGPRWTARHDRLRFEIHHQLQNVRSGVVPGGIGHIFE